ncbi:hypothetical protein [Corynebacterium sp. CCM 9204]|uniref:hypothetical protein n=1 Tax=Corynebacterium sp. CCM 9204 TaxID=3057616 RepID=UPI003524C157
MLGGFLGIVNGALLAKTAGSFDSTEIELAAPTPYFITLGARFLAVMINVIFWPVVFCALLTGGQLISGTADVAITAGAIVLIGLFGLNSAVLMAFFISSLLPKSLGLIAGIAFWGYLIFVPNSFGIPTLNGSVFSLLGDQYCTRLFAVTPIFEGSYMGGSSLVLLAVVIMTLFVHILLFGAASTLIKGKVLK